MACLHAPEMVGKDCAQAETKQSGRGLGVIGAILAAFSQPFFFGVFLFLLHIMTATQILPFVPNPHCATLVTKQGAIYLLMSSLALFHTLSLLYLSKRTATVFIYPAASAAFTVAETLSFNQFSLVYPHIFNLHLYGSGHARRECSVYRAFSLPRPRKACKSEVLVWCDRAKHAGDGGDAIETGDFVFVCVVSLVPCC